LIASPLAKGLFRGAIMESGTIFAVYNWPGNFTHGDLNSALIQGKMLYRALKLDDNKNSLESLRKLDPGLLASISTFNLNWTKFVPFSLPPVLDNYVIPINLQKTLSTGDFNRV
jgi:carboxylesterase type B